MTLKEIQQIQKDYDIKYFLHLAPEKECVRHITLHIGKLLGKLATYCEAFEDDRKPDNAQIKDEVVPDLLVWALGLANLYNLDLEEKFLERHKSNIQKKHTDI